ncbi:Gfo/Idh/MocA family protein [Candidatus Zixiibacteriota bacterium]
MSEKKDGPNRREFIEIAGLVGAAGAAGLMAAGCSGGGVGDTYADYQYPDMLETAPDGPVLKAGLIGCGGRGTGAAGQFLSAGPNLEIVSLADVFQDRLDGCRNSLRRNHEVEVADENCFTGFDCHERLLETDVDVVLLATPPYFRPSHFEAAVDARKHIFMEKPAGVDPVGIRSVMAAARRAEGAGLTIVTGTQRRHQANYLATFRQITRGAIGQIVSANVYWNGVVPWFRERQRGWDDVEYMLRDWVNWIWGSGDHIVEQHVHNLDVAHWFMGAHPVKAVGFGSRHRRPSGDQFDNFSIDYVFEDGRHVHSMCRQISGCANNVSEFLMGTEGYTNGIDKIWDLKGNLVWEYPYETDEEGNRINNPRPYFQEHIDLVTSIRQNRAFNEAENTAISTMVAVMGRTSAYTGKEVTWEEMMNSDMKLGPDPLEFGPSDLVRGVVPVPGTA